MCIAAAFPIVGTGSPLGIVTRWIANSSWMEKESYWAWLIPHSSPFANAQDEISPTARQATSPPNISAAGLNRKTNTRSMMFPRSTSPASSSSSASTEGLSQLRSRSLRGIFLFRQRTDVVHQAPNVRRLGARTRGWHCAFALRDDVEEFPVRFVL